MDSIETLLTRMRDKSSDFADAFAERSYLEEFKKSKLAILMKDAEKDGHKTTAAQEREARANKEYLTVLDGLKEATAKSEKLRWELEIAKLAIGTWQTKQANQRVERKAYGG